MQELCSNVHLLDRGSPTPLTVLDARSQQCQLKARPSCVVQCQCRVSLVYHADSWLQLGPQFTEQYYLQGRMRHRWSHEFTASHSIPVLISLTNVHFLSWPGYTVAGLLSAILSSHVFLYLLLPARMRDNTNGAVFFLNVTLLDARQLCSSKKAYAMSCWNHDTNGIVRYCCKCWCVRCDYGSVQHLHTVHGHAPLATFNRALPG